MEAVNTNGKDAVKLCENIVRHAFGDVVCRVASTLLNRGRCTSFTVSRLSGVSRQMTNASLIILIQHNLVGSTGVSRRAVSGDEMYEFDVTECLLRLRWPRILALTEQSFGEEAVEIVRHLFTYGKLKMPEIINASNAANDGTRAALLRRTTVTLIQKGFIEPTCPELLILRSDQIDRRFTSMRNDKSAATGTKLHSATVLSELRKAAANEIDEERKAYRDPEHALRAAPKIGKKSGAGSSSSKGKERSEFEVVDTQHLRVNYDKYNVLIRNEMLIKAAHDRWNAAAAEVFRAVLTASIADQHEAKEIRTARPVGINSIIDNIPTSSYKLIMAGITGSVGKSVPDLVRSYLAVMSGDDLMPDHAGVRFLRCNADSNPTWHVEIESICTALKASLLTELVRDRVGVKAARVLSVVARAHYASETMVRDCAMIPLREARQFLSELQKLSLIEIQEVPKTAAAKGRQMFPGNDFHLWGIDLRKSYGFLLSGVYKTLSNIVQRRGKELERRTALLAKVERPDLKGSIEHLSGKDQADLADLQNALTMLSLAETRTDLIVMMLRDLPGGVPPR